MRVAGWIALSVAAAGVLCLTLGDPFVHHLDSNGTQVGFMARNVVKFGPVVRDVSGPTLDAYPDRAIRHAYVNHPPLVYWFVATSTALLGDRESSVRVVPILFSLLTLGVTVALARRLLPAPGAAAAAGVLTAMTPMFGYVSVATVHQAPTLGFLLLSFYFYWRWRDVRRGGWFAAMLAAQAAACWTDWPGYYGAALLLLHDTIERRSWRSPLWTAIALNFLCFGAYLAFVHAANPATGLKTLTSAAGDRSTPPALAAYLLGEGREMLKYFTGALLLAALGGWIALARGPKTDASRFLLMLPILSLDQVAFTRECFNHDYYSFYWLPALSLTAAAAFGLLRGRRRWVALPIAAAVMAQGAWQTHRLFTQVGALEFYRHLARAVETATPPEARVLIVVDNLGLHTPYYTDRFMVSWSPVSGHAKNSDTTRPIFTGDAAALRDWAAGHGITHVAWAVPEEVGPAVPQAGDLPRFGVPVDPALRAWLDPRPTVRVAGFRITSLHK